MKADKIFALILVFLGIGYLVSMLVRWFKNQEIAPTPTASSDAGFEIGLKPISKVLVEGESYTFPANSIYGLDILPGGETQYKSGGGDNITIYLTSYSFAQKTSKYQVDIQVKSIVGTTNLVYYVA